MGKVEQAYKNEMTDKRDEAFEEAGEKPAFRRKAIPSESACTYDIAACGGDYCSSQSSRQCHKYYGVSCGIATTKTAAKPPVTLCESKAYSSRQGAKKAVPDTA